MRGSISLFFALYLLGDAYLEINELEKANELVVKMQEIHRVQVFGSDAQNGVATARWSATSLPRSFDW